MTIFDLMNQEEKYINFNGKIIPESHLKISMANRSFRYGDGLFESIRIRNGQALFIEDHLKRLFEGIKVLKMVFPDDNAPDFKKLISETCNANIINSGGYARLIVFRGGEGKFRPESHKTEFVIEVSPIDNEFIWSKKNLNIGVFPDFKKPINLLSSVKSNNAQLQILASIYAAEKNLDDVLILNENDEIIEATSSNLFWIKDKIIFTPSLSSGPLPGIMRNQVLSICKSLSYNISEICPDENTLLEADEIFLTNAISGIKPVSGFGQKRFFRNISLKIVNEINKHSENYLLSPPDLS